MGGQGARQAFLELAAVKNEESGYAEYIELRTQIDLRDLFRLRRTHKDLVSPLHHIVEV